MLDHNEERCVLRVGVDQEHIVISPVLIGFDYVIILYDATFDFADVTKNGILCWNIQFTFSVFCPRRLLFKRYIERLVLTRESRKHQWNLFF